MAIGELGADRVIFSIDYPYEEIQEGVDWWKTVKPEDVGGKDALEKLSWKNAVDLLKLKMSS
jgi:predicted TIM-barrel fold metal-dependent hydrolase